MHHGFYHEDRLVSLRVRAETVLELSEVALVSKVEMRSGDECWGLHLTLSHVLQII